MADIDLNADLGEGFGVRRLGDDNAIMTDREQAGAVAEAVRMVDATLPVLGLAGSAFFAEASRPGVRTVVEAFADRACRGDGGPVSRREPGAVRHDPAQIADRVVAVVNSGQVAAIDRIQIGVRVESIRVHGDSPGAVQIAAAVRDRRTDSTAVRAVC